MIICDHGKDPKVCTLCKGSLAKVLAEIGAPPQPVESVRVAADPDRANPVQEVAVRIPNTPEITDPQAKNVLQLAQEYAQAQDEVAKLSTLRFKLRDEADEAQKNFEAAKLVCAEKQKALHLAVAPQPKSFLYPDPSAAIDINGDQ